jgi:hypothetical protein
VADLPVSESVRRDPDPLSIVLATLGAVGSIASIVSLVEQKRQSYLLEGRLARAERSELVEHLGSAEAALAELSAFVSRVRLMTSDSAVQTLRDRVDLPDPDRYPAFGEHGLMLDQKEVGKFFMLQDLAFRHARMLQKSLSSAFRVLYRSDAGLPEEQFENLVGVIRSVNALLRQHESVHDLIARTEVVCNQATTTIHALRETISHG